MLHKFLEVMSVVYWASSFSALGKFYGRHRTAHSVQSMQNEFNNRKAFDRKKNQRICQFNWNMILNWNRAIALCIRQHVQNPIR